MSEQEKKNNTIVAEGKVEETKVEVKQSWFRRNKKKVAIGAGIIAALTTVAGILLKVAKHGKTNEDIEEDDADDVTEE